MMGFMINGFFAEYALLDVESAVRIPERADMAALAPVFCAGVTVWDGLNQISAPKGSWIAYVGCGGLGISLEAWLMEGHLGIQYAAKLGYKVVGIDIHDDQLALVRSLGASHTFNSRTEDKDLAAKVAEVTGPAGLSAVVVTSAAQQAYRTAMDIVGIKGQIIVTGLPNAPLPILAGELCFKYVEYTLFLRS
jgi:D-arabinose 1-dehydrogenase-like Zn-dependent alcohol dehydrogenase